MANGQVYASPQRKNPDLSKVAQGNRALYCLSAQRYVIPGISCEEGATLSLFEGNLYESLCYWWHGAAGK